MKTINFCGDSYCKKAIPEAYTAILAKKLNAKIIGLGAAGSAYEHAIQSFDPSADYTVFCWTEAHRIYTRNINAPITPGWAEAHKNDTPKYKAAYIYYKFLHDWNYAEEVRTRILYWFDETVLSKYEGKAIHLSCFDDCVYNFRHGIIYPKTLNLLRDDPFCINVKNEIANHFTLEQNAQLAEELYECLKP